MRTTITIWTVHGTSPHTDWHKSGKLYSALVSAFPNARIIPHDWSGCYTQSARLKASKRLAEKIDAHVNANPDGQHIIIGHSHGGNIAAYAAGDERIRGKNIRVISLGTPFLVLAAPQHPTTRALFGIVAFLFVTTYLFSLPIFSLLPDTRQSQLTQGLVTAIVLFTLIVVLWKLLVLVVPVIKLGAVFSKGKNISYIDSVIRAEYLISIPEEKLLAIRISGDEPLGVLSGITSISNFLRRWDDRLSAGALDILHSFEDGAKPSAFARRSRLILRGTIASVLGTFTVYSFPTAAENASATWLIFALGLVLGWHITPRQLTETGTIVIVILLSLCAGLLRALYAISGFFSIGFDSISVAILTGWFVEPIPLGRHTVVNIDAGHLENMSHSEVYESEESIRTIIARIQWWQDHP